MLGLRFFAVLALLLLLSGCGSEDKQPTGEPRIRASALKGHTPLNVSFMAENVANTPQYSWTWDFGDGSSPLLSVGGAVHTFVKTGVYEVTFQYKDPYGSARKLSEKVTVEPTVNLVVSNFAIPATIVPGQDNTISATIKNLGTDPVSANGKLHVGYYLSEDEEITVDDILIGDTTIVLGSSQLKPGQYGISSLGPQETYSYNHQLHVRTNIPAGAYFAGAIVDDIDYYDWYSFPAATATDEYTHPVFVTIDEVAETDNTSVPLETFSSGQECIDDGYESDDSPSQATPLELGELQDHNLCFDNSDWFSFEADAGTIYQITTAHVGTKVDTQLILYGPDGKEIVLFHDNIGNGPTTEDDTGLRGNGRFSKVSAGKAIKAIDDPDAVDEDPDAIDEDPDAVEEDPDAVDEDPDAEDEETVEPVMGVPAEIVWRAMNSGRYFVKVRTATCDEDKSTDYCANSPGGVGTETDYTILLQ